MYTFIMNERCKNKTVEICFRTHLSAYYYCCSRSVFGNKRILLEISRNAIYVYQTGMVYKVVQRIALPPIQVLFVKCCLATECWNIIFVIYSAGFAQFEEQIRSSAISLTLDFTLWRFDCLNKLNGSSTVSLISEREIFENKVGT